jgi:hypothetical protein
MPAIESDILRMKIPGKVCSPLALCARGDLLIGRIQTKTGPNHLLPVAGARTARSINFS